MNWRRSFQEMERRFREQYTRDAERSGLWVDHDKIARRARADAHSAVERAINEHNEKIREQRLGEPAA